MKKLIILYLLFISSFLYGQTVIFTEGIGTVGGTTTIVSHESANGFDNDVYTMTQGGTTNPGDIRNTIPSSGYTGSSGLANVWLTSTNGAYGFAIEGIDASSYISLTIQFAYRKENSTSLPTLSLDYWNGISWINIPFSFNEISTSTASWYLTPIINVPSGAQISGLKFRWIKSGTVACRIDDIIFKGTPVVSCTSPTITTQPSSYTKCTGESVIFSVTSTCSSGSLSYQWRKNGTNISGANSTSYNIPSIVLGDAANYDVVVTCNCGSNPTTTSNVGILTVNSCALYPQMTGCLINSCNGACDEGYNEILFFNSNETSITVNPTNIQIFYGSVIDSPDPTKWSNYTESFVSNSSYINQLNDSSDCGNIFFDALSVGVIPTNSIFIIMRSNPCYPYNLSDFCGQGNIYCLFSSDATWKTSGNFVNGDVSGKLRYFRTIINGNIIEYNYEPFLLTDGGDGDAISFPENGGAANAYFNNGCIPPPTVLPISLLEFTSICEGTSRKIYWTTATEINADKFELYRSFDAINYELFYTTNAIGYSIIGEGYVTYDNDLYIGDVYYKLKEIDFDGVSETFDIIAVDCGNTTDINIYPNPGKINEEIVISGDIHTIVIYDILGRIVNAQIINNKVSGLSSGIYFFIINDNFETKVIIN